MICPPSLIRKISRLSAFAVGLSSVALFTPGLTGAPILQPGDLLAITGDSITEQKHYSVFIENYLLMCQPVRPVRTMQFGWGGTTATHLDQRLQKDVLTFKPTVVTTSYGMNDGRYNAITPEVENTYRARMQSAVAKMKKSGVREIVIGSPSAVDSAMFANRNPAVSAEVYNQTLARLGEIAREVATSEHVGFADVHTLAMEVMVKAKARYGAAYPVWGMDGVHPRRNGHLVMAYAYLKALGCDGNIGTIELDAASGKASATEGHSVIQSDRNSVQVESTRYPFCFIGKPDSPDATSGIIEFFPFNEDLNRYMFKVTNLAAPRARVTWGDTSKEFSAEELEKGINLTVEFPITPFASAFSKVEAAVTEQQRFETVFIKLFLDSYGQYQRYFSGMKDKWPALLQEITDEHLAVTESARSAVEPVTHTLRVDPLTGL